MLGDRWLHLETRSSSLDHCLPLLDLNIASSTGQCRILSQMDLHQISHCHIGTLETLSVPSKTVELLLENKSVLSSGSTWVRVWLAGKKVRKQNVVPPPTTRPPLYVDLCCCIVSPDFILYCIITRTTRGLCH